MSTVAQFIELVSAKGSDVRFVRQEEGGVLPCPCQTPEGFRDPRFHLELTAYGPQVVTVEPFIAGFAANAQVFLLFQAGNAQNARTAPEIGVGPFTLNQPFQLRIGGVRWPTRGNVDRFFISHSLDGGATYHEVGIIMKSGGPEFIDLGNPGGAYTEGILCNEAGEIPVLPTDLSIKGFVQPIQSTRATRLNNEILTQLFGEVQADDHLGIFPCSWGGREINFRDWPQGGEDFIEYDGQKFLVVNVNKIPDPSDGNPAHHWEVGLRLIGDPL